MTFSRETLTFAAEVIRARFCPRDKPLLCWCGAPATRGNETYAGWVRNEGCDTHAPHSPPLRSLAAIADIERALRGDR